VLRGAVGARCGKPGPLSLMHSNFALMRRLAFEFLLACSLLAGCGCGGGGSVGGQTPITVSFPVSTVTVTPGGPEAIIPINITSTSETALVMIKGLPGGVQERYSASDTNPSGSLGFTANASATPGTYMPTVTVNSAGQTASASFTLIVAASQ